MGWKVEGEGEPDLEAFCPFMKSSLLHGLLRYSSVYLRCRGQTKKRRKNTKITWNGVNNYSNVLWQFPKSVNAPLVYWMNGICLQVRENLSTELFFYGRRIIFVVVCSNDKDKLINYLKKYPLISTNGKIGGKSLSQKCSTYINRRNNSKEGSELEIYLEISVEFSMNNCPLVLRSIPYKLIS